MMTAQPPPPAFDPWSTQETREKEKAQQIRSTALGHAINGAGGRSLPPSELIRVAAIFVAYITEGAPTP